MVRIWFITGVVAFVGTLVSGIVAYRTFEQERALTRIALFRAIDIHASHVQDRFLERELLARVTSNLLQAPQAAQAHVLQPLRTSIYAFRTDFVVAAWIARLDRAEFSAAQEQLKNANAPDFRIRNFDDTPVEINELTANSYVVMDAEPREQQANAYLGRIINRNQALVDLLNRSLSERKPTASDPVQLLGKGGPWGIVLMTPVLRQSGPIGLITYSYRLSHLMLQGDSMSMFTVALVNPTSPRTEFVSPQSSDVALRAIPDGGDAPIERTLSFGGKDWALRYYPSIDIHQLAMRSSLVAGSIGLGLTLLACLLYGYAGYNNIRLRREIEVRKTYEHRLTAMIDELNHRVKNVLAVIQSIITRTLRHGSGVERARELLIGRIHAMSSVVSLLSDTNWQGVSLTAMFDPRTLARADRIEASGPEIMISARAAQSLSLVLFELASHADEGLSLVGQPPHILAVWHITGEGKKAVFHFKWEERNISLATRRPDTEFGLVLLDRVAPEALGGQARRYFTDNSFVYELTAPLETLIDLNERMRTSVLSSPVGD